VKGNMGIIDRIIRVALAGVVAALYFTRQLTGTAAVVLGVVAVVLLATGAVGFCPLYAPFKLSTKRRKVV
jgi:hypothetical protein